MQTTFTERFCRKSRTEKKIYNGGWEDQYLSLYIHSILLIQIKQNKSFLVYRRLMKKDKGTLLQCSIPRKMKVNKEPYQINVKAFFFQNIIIFRDK